MLAVQVARICRQRRLALVVAGDARLAAKIGAGFHLRGGRRAGPVRPRGLITSSAHGIVELRRARSHGAKIVFLSPAFATRSHAETGALGAVRWSNIARQGYGVKIYSLGGINGDNVFLLAHFCTGVGAITALIS